MNKEEILEKSRDENWPADEMEKGYRLRRIITGAIGMFICAIVISFCKIYYKHEAPWDIMSMFFAFSVFVALHELITRRSVWEKLLYLICSLIMFCFLGIFFMKFLTGVM